MNKIEIVRIYSKAQPTGGFRVLVDRVWPRGISKENAQLDLWSKEIGPSTELRKWFNHEDEKYPEFRTKYRAELDQNPATKYFVGLIKEKLQTDNVIFLFGAKNEQHNQAVVLQEYLTEKIYFLAL